MDGGLVADGQLVEAGGYGTVAFEPGDPALDDVSLLVEVWVGLVAGPPTIINIT